MNQMIEPQKHNNQRQPGNIQNIPDCIWKPQQFNQCAEYKREHHKDPNQPLRLRPPFYPYRHVFFHDILPNNSYFCSLFCIASNRWQSFTHLCRIAQNRTLRALP